MALKKEALLNLILHAHKLGASDVHLRTGCAPAFRVKMELKPVKFQALTDEDMHEVCRLVLPEALFRDQLKTFYELDGSFEVPDQCRFRYNVFRHDGRLGAVLRIIPLQIPTPDEMGFSPVFQKIANMERALILITGATGSGKSTTLASIIEHINRTQKKHILTIEDPIEFIHAPKSSHITRREVGRDTSSFASALRAALRQDPDVIMVGEMRDAQSVEMALKAAETGHTVFSTIHTTDATKTISRLVSMFPPEEQEIARFRLADYLKATVSQRMLRRCDNEGLVVAQEIMISNTAIQECIIDPNRTNEIHKFIEHGTQLLGSQTFEQHLVNLFRRGVVTLEEAKNASNSPADFERNLQYGEVSDVIQRQASQYDDEETLQTNPGQLDVESSPFIQRTRNPEGSGRSKKERQSSLMKKPWKVVRR